jgi:hypothetical protein
MENVRAHEGEDRHDIVQHGLRRKASQVRHEQQCLVERGGVLSDSNQLDENINADGRRGQVGDVLEHTVN